MPCLHVGGEGHVAKSCESKQDRIPALCRKTDVVHTCHDCGVSQRVASGSEPRRCLRTVGGKDVDKRGSQEGWRPVVVLRLDVGAAGCSPSAGDRAATTR